MELPDTDAVEDTDDTTAAVDDEGEDGVTAGLGVGADTRPGPCPGGGWFEVINRGLTPDTGPEGRGWPLLVFCPTLTNSNSEDSLDPPFPSGFDWG